MENKQHFTDKSDVEDFEIAILEANNDGLRQKLAELEIFEKIKQEDGERFIAIVAKHAGLHVTCIEDTENLKLPVKVWREIVDEAFGTPDNLIQPSHHLFKYSLIRKRSDLENYIPIAPKTSSVSSTLELLTIRSSSRAFEITSEYTSENTRLAHCGDLIYWQAWLSAIGFSFNGPITEKELMTFIVQHAEGLDAEIDKKLLEQGYKAKLGPHKLSTIKRRLASLSVFLDDAKWPNPCNTKEIKLLLSKLTKKYGSSRSAGKAITKDILNDMLDTCSDKLIDVRDRALLLFAWGSGGRRRTEVSSAQTNDLTKTPTGEFVYTIPRSKTDQEGKGHQVPVKGRAALALAHWLQITGITDGALFRSVKKGSKLGRPLSDVDIYRIVKSRLKKAKYDETQFGAHSLRSGFVTEAGRRQKPLGDVMALTTHRSINTVMRYYQAGSIINNSAANLAD